MPTIVEGDLKFEFPNDWQASKLDDWSFYRNQFAKLAKAEIVCKNCAKKITAGVKSMDVMAIKDSVCWLIEIKDYRRYQRTKAIDLADEIALKVRDSLAMIAVARINAYDATESALAQSASRCSQMRIVLHLEQPTTHSKLFPRAINLANVQDKLKKLIKSVDSHPQVVEMSGISHFDWSVTSNTLNI